MIKTDLKELYDFIDYYSVHENKTNRRIQQFFDLAKSKKICIYGAGVVGVSIASALISKGHQIGFFCDRDIKKQQHGAAINGIKCISYERLLEMKDVVVVFVAVGFGSEEICGSLQRDGIPYIPPFEREMINFDFWNTHNVNEFRAELVEVSDSLSDEYSKKIFMKTLSRWFDGKAPDFRDVVSENQYFDKNVYRLSDDETLVDSGAYDGDTIMAFLNAADNKFNKIHAYELSRKNYCALVQNISLLDKSIMDKIVCHNQGLGSLREHVSYVDSGSSATVYDTPIDEDITDAEIVPLDDCLDDEITLVKMDIEGYELDALKGMRKLIIKYKPKLAICIYHKPQDIWEIPLYIKSLVPGYKLYFRHYTPVEHETVCYAIYED